MRSAGRGPVPYDVPEWYDTLALILGLARPQRHSALGFATNVFYMLPY